jgi:hypothetical protein
VQQSELAIWSEPGQPVQRGVVKWRGSSKAAVLVEWESGREERVRAGAPGVRYAMDGSRRLQWILDRKALESQFSRDAASVFVDVIHDEGKPIQSAQIKRRVIELGLDPAEVDEAFVKSKPALRANLHVIVKGATHTWSDVEVDPYGDLRKMAPEDALDYLLAKPRLTIEQKRALADAIRAGFG